MSGILVCGRVNKNCIDEKLLEKVIMEFFLPVSIIVKQVNNNCVTYEGITADNKVIISFVNKNGLLSNFWESNIISGKFEYVQLIIFDINKSDATIDTYKNIIEFCIYLRVKIKSDILVTSEVHDDICLLKELEIIWAQDKYAIFDPYRGM